MAPRARLWPLLTSCLLVACSAFVSDDFTKGDGPTAGQGGAAPTGAAGDTGVAGAAGDPGAAGAPVDPLGAGGKPSDPAGPMGMGPMGMGPMGMGGGEACVPPAPLLCPPYCLGGCADGTCHIECVGDQACKARKFIVCPSGYACDVICQDKQACQDARITCPPCASCTVACKGEQACAETDLKCGDGGTCQKTCEGKDACKGAKGF